MGKSSINKEVRIPHIASSGSTLMRVVMSLDGSLDPCGAFFEGEVEDYTINIFNRVTPPDNNIFDSPSYSKINLFPNPVGDLLHIDLEEEANHNRIEIYDSFGRLIEIINTEKGKQTYLFDTRDLQPGLYIALLFNTGLEKAATSKKFLKINK